MGRLGCSRVTHAESLASAGGSMVRIGHLALIVVSLLAACAAPGSTRSPTASTDAQGAPSSAPVGAAATSSIGAADAEPPLLARLHVPHSSVSATHAPIWVAIEKGYF